MRANTNSLNSRWAKAECLGLLIGSGFVINNLLADHISKSYDNERSTALDFAVPNTDIHCTEVLNTVPAVQHALNDEVRLRLSLNDGCRVELRFECMCGDIFGNRLCGQR